VADRFTPQFVRGIRRPDPRRVAAAPQASNYIDLSALKVPEVVEWSNRTGEYGLYGNDRFGCCGPVSIANLIRQWSANDGSPKRPPQDDVFKAYREVGRWNGSDSGSGTDQGVDPIALAEYLVSSGLGPSKASAYVVVDHKNAELVKACHWLFGGLCVCVNMPTAWRDDPKYANNWPGPMDQRTLSRSEWLPGGWGGHAIMSADITAEGLQCGTWGRLQGLSFNGLKVYGMVVIGFLSSEWFGDDRKAPNGFDADQLAADMEVIRKGGKIERNKPTPAPVSNWKREAASLVVSAFGGKYDRVDDKTDKVTW
jgi:hypothetical protein